MKKILGGISVLLCLLLVGNVKAVGDSANLGLNDGQTSSQNVEVKLGNITDESYSIDLIWDSMEYNYKALGKDEQTGETTYVWEPRDPEKSNYIMVTSFSTKDVMLSLSWNSSVTGLTMNAGHEVNDLVGHCEAVNDPNIADSNAYDEFNEPYWVGYYTDSACQTKAYELVNGNVYYMMKPTYEWSEDQTSPWRITGYTMPDWENVFDEMTNVKAQPHHRWSINLNGEVDRASLTEGMTLGTITVSISDVE